MRVLLTATAAVDQRLDGLTVFTDSLARRLAAGGHEVALFVSNTVRHPEHARLDEVEVRGLGVFRAALPLARGVEEALDAPGCDSLFGEALGAFRPDAVHFGNLELLSAGMIDVAAARATPAVMTLHDYYLVCPAVRLMTPRMSQCRGPAGGRRCSRCLGATWHLTGRYAGPWRWLARRWDVLVRRRYAAALRGRFERMASLMAKVSAVVSPSRYLGDLVVREGMLREYEHIPYGSELEAIPRREGGGPLALGMLAQHAPAKGTHLLLEAARSVPGLDLRLAIFGAGDAAYLRRIRRMASADRRVTVEGPFAPGDVPRILGGIDALAVPSLWPENSPLVIQDALAAGRPCVVPSDSGAAEPVARERYGLCFARGNAASLAAALTRLVGEPGLMDRLRRNIAEDRPVPGRQAVAERYLAVYRKALDRGRPPR